MALIRLLFLICLFSTLAFASGAQVLPDSGVIKRAATVTAKPSIKVKYDHSKVLPRSFDKQQLQKYSRDRDFIYDDNAVVGKSLWDSFWEWFWSLLDDLFGKTATGSFVKYLVICLMIVFAVYAIVKFSGVNLNILSGKSKGIDIPYTESMDNIHEIDFSEEIEAAVAAGNYRLGVRLHYLRTLKMLNDRNLINWQPEKTNSTYVNEISDSFTRQHFAQLTTSFEYVWYGNFAVNADNFKGLKERFDQFNHLK